MERREVRKVFSGLMEWCSESLWAASVVPWLGWLWVGGFRETHTKENSP